MAELDPNHPRVQTAKVEAVFHDIAKSLRDDIKLVQDPRARALFETAAEVIGGLEKAFHDYDKKDELAWS